MKRLLLLLILFGAFFLRVWHLDSTPPGWRDDELINSLVISQKALDGDLQVYYADASGHEASYHWLNAGMLGLFGANWVGIRLLSAYLGLLTVALTFAVGRKLLGDEVALGATAVLAVSFWSLMYSRIGLRHVLAPVWTLGAFYWFWQGILAPRAKKITWRVFLPFLWAGLFLALGWYTYFAGRGVLLILLVFCLYLLIVDWQLFKQKVVGMGLMFGVTAVLLIPLFINLSNQPEGDARVAELAVPIVALQEGDVQPLLEYTRITLSMFHATGDNEWLYNIPERPLFSLPLALLFWVGVGLTVFYVFGDWYKRWQVKKGTATQRVPTNNHVFAFLFLWFLAGIAPGFVSVPPASLGHTIVAQTAVMLLLMLPLKGILNYAELASPQIRNSRKFVQFGSTYIILVFGVLLMLMVAARDLPDYFGEWPERGMTRFLYRADIQDVADYLNKQPTVTEFGMTGLLAGPWDALALTIDTDHAIRPRWYNPERVLLLEPNVSFYGYPDVPLWQAGAYQPQEAVGGYTFGTVVWNDAPLAEEVCFVNGLCVTGVDYLAPFLTLHIRANDQWEPLVQPLISNPPPPNVYNGPRLHLFTQLLDQDGNFLTGDDGLWIDPATIYAGDRFLQQHLLFPQEPATQINIGFYDPLTGERILTTDGTDALQLQITDK